MWKWNRIVLLITLAGTDRAGGRCHAFIDYEEKTRRQSLMVVGEFLYCMDKTFVLLMYPSCIVLWRNTINIEDIGVKKELLRENVFVVTLF